MWRAMVNIPESCEIFFAETKSNGVNHKNVVQINV